MKLRRILKVLRLQVTQKSPRCIFTIDVFKKEAVSVCCEVQTHFGSPPLPRFTEKVLAAFSHSVCP